ncbi:hemerythrin domain-containing protein [Blastococcus haudaquaticus]|uniref:Hemerythrin HHE cation binding domain-containing protein n=1 Tax=Blastococcus haudaquaticus TaxID=1938745 RepID=A0A286H6C5_9ACTN|nr:hemerythrin domain-containing protein [Blastococcus haudaquaticus]SOE03026.1 Hemerythrin HHE cation binding domain-containing protein [Blastococcus haudaquaticus]
MTNTERDVVDLLSADHREFDRIFRELEQLRGATGPDVVQRKRELVDEVTIGLAQHSVAEETQVYPLVEEQLDAEEAEHSKEEHAEAEETMKRLERMDAGDPEFDAVVAHLIGEIRHHVEHEEGRMFAALRANLSRGQLVELAGKVESVKKFAPTRPHPLTPNDATVRRVAAPLAGLLDHLRDAVSGRGKRAD